VKGTKQDTISVEGQSGRLVADRWGLPYREAHTLSIDPAALELVDREESRRLRVLPLELGPDGPVFAVAEPSEERFAAVRDLAGESASFVMVAEETLDALLNSKFFGVSTDSGRRGSLPWARERRPAVTEAQPAGETEPPAPEPDVDSSAAEDEPGPPPEPEPEPEPETAAAGAPTPRGSNALDELLTRITTEASSLRTQVTELSAALEAAQSELREANEELAAAHRTAEGHEEVVTGLQAEIGGLQGEIAGLRDELASTSTLNDTTTARLEEVMRALTGPAAREAEG
jgi:hypothetical protein